MCIRSICSIASGTELCVWYSATYGHEPDADPVKVVYKAKSQFPKAPDRSSLSTDVINGKSNG